MKLTKSLLTLVLAFVCVFALFGCGLSQSDADKINEKAEAGENYTYQEIIDKYGDPTVNFSEEIPVVGRTGILYYMEGITKEEYDKAKEEGTLEEALKDVKSLTITIVNGKATKAMFYEQAQEATK